MKSIKKREKLSKIWGNHSKDIVTHFQINDEKYRDWETVCVCVCVREGESEKEYKFFGPAKTVRWKIF